MKTYIKRRYFYSACTILMIVVGLFLGACSRRDDSSKAKAKTSPPVHVVLQLKWIYNAGFAGDLVAKEKGYWLKHGLDVDVRAGGVSVTPIKVVTAGDAQFGVATGDQLLLATAEQNPIKAIALAYARNPLAWIVRADSGIRKPADLKGRKVGLSFIDDEALFNAMMQTAALDSKRDLQIVPIKFDTSPFLRGDVDAFPVYENTQALELAAALKPKGIATSLVSPSDNGLISYSNLYFTTNSYVQQHPDVVQGFVAGVLEGWDYVVAHPVEAAAIVAKFDKEEKPDAILESVKATIRLVKPSQSAIIGQMTESGWASTQNILLKSNQLKRSQELSQIYSNNYVDAFYKTR